MLKRKQFEKCVNYLKEVDEAISLVNAKYGLDQNDMIYSYIREKVKNGTKQYQLCKHRMCYMPDRQWNLNVYFSNCFLFNISIPPLLSNVLLNQLNLPLNQS